MTARKTLLRSLWAMRSGRVSMLILGTLLLLAALAPVLPIADPAAINLADKFAAPGGGHWLGTDNLGRDIFSRLVWGGRASLVTALAATAATALFGAVYGGISATAGRRVDAVMMRFCDLWMSFPSEVLILAVVGMLGPGLMNVVFGCFIAKWPWYARMTRTIARRVLDTGYVGFARTTGASRGWILTRHMLPNVAGDLCVLATLDVGSVLLMISSLSFLGLGVASPSSEWGMMLAEARDVMTLYPWQMAAPGCMILLAVTQLHFLGDALARVFGPDGVRDAGEGR